MLDLPELSYPGLSVRESDYVPSLRGAPLPGDERPRLLLGVTTFNRREYVERIVESFEATRSRDFAWTLVVADDGSTDSTLEYLDRLALPDCQVVVVRNQRATVTGQTNAIFAVAESVGFDLAFKADDDIFFVKPGWDSLYLEASRSSGVSHLIYHNPSWTRPQHEVREGALLSSVPLRATMGCFWTFTPEMLAAVGGFDEPSFRLRGHSHWDFSLRAARLGFTSAETAWDAAGSNEFVDMWPRDEYLSTFDWSSPEAKKGLTAEERARRQAILDDESRTYLPREATSLGRRPALVRLAPFDRALAERLEARALRPSSRPLERQVDRAFVLNLRHDVDKWTRLARELAELGLPVERLPAVDGMTPEVRSQWREYFALGPQTPRELQLRRRSIASAGAWGYLLGMRRVLEEAIRDRLGVIALFDDDVALHEDAAELLPLVLDELPEDWKLCYLGATGRSWGSAKPYTEHLYRPRAHVDGSYAVLVHHTAFAELLASVERMEAPFDSGALTELTQQHPAEVFVAWPNLAIADVRSSALREAREQETFAVRARWSLEDYDYDFSVPPTASGASEPRVSLLVPLTSASSHAWDFLGALRRQDMRDFEVLLVPSPEHGHVVEHAEQLAATDSRVRVLVPARAVSWANLANVALEQARAELLSLPRPSEISDPRRLSSLLESLGDASYLGARLRLGPRAGSRAIHSFASGLVRTELVRSSGGFEVDGTESVADVLRRASIANGGGLSLRSASFAPAVVGFDRDLDRPWDERSAPSDLGKRYAEIQVGQRSARVLSWRESAPVSYSVRSTP